MGESTLSQHRITRRRNTMMNVSALSCKDIFQVNHKTLSFKGVSFAALYDRYYYMELLCQRERCSSAIYLISFCRRRVLHNLAPISVFEPSKRRKICLPGVKGRSVSLIAFQEKRCYFMLLTS